MSDWIKWPRTSTDKDSTYPPRYIHTSELKMYEWVNEILNARAWVILMQEIEYMSKNEAETLLSMLKSSDEDINLALMLIKIKRDGSKILS